MTVYLVTGQRGYRGHHPDTTFEAALKADAEARALARGDIQIVNRTTPSLQPGSFTVPTGWLPQEQEG